MGEPSVNSSSRRSNSSTNSSSGPGSTPNPQTTNNTSKCSQTTTTKKPNPCDNKIVNENVSSKGNDDSKSENSDQPKDKPNGKSDYVSNQPVNVSGLLQKKSNRTPEYKEETPKNNLVQPHPSLSRSILNRHTIEKESDSTLQRSGETPEKLLLKFPFQSSQPTQVEELRKAVREPLLPIRLPKEEDIIRSNLKHLSSKDCSPIPVRDETHKHVPDVEFRTPINMAIDAVDKLLSKKTNEAGPVLQCSPHRTSNNKTAEAIRSALQQSLKGRSLENESSATYHVSIDAKGRLKDVTIESKSRLLYEAEDIKNDMIRRLKNEPIPISKNATETHVLVEFSSKLDIKKRDPIVTSEVMPKSITEPEVEASGQFEFFPGPKETRKTIVWTSVRDTWETKR